jgi:hypothetical protein
MAKDKYTVSTNVDIIGRLDYNQQEELVVYIEKGKGDNMIIVEVPLMDILQSCAGKQMILKLTEEEDRCDE